MVEFILIVALVLTIAIAYANAQNANNAQKVEMEAVHISNTELSNSLADSETQLELLNKELDVVLAKNAALEYEVQTLQPKKSKKTVATKSSKKKMLLHSGI